MSSPPLPMNETKSAVPQIKSKDIKKEAYYTATQFQLMWWKFRRHRAAIIGSIVLGVLYFIMVFCEFLAPYGSQTRDSDYIFGKPQKSICMMKRAHFKACLSMACQPVLI